MKLYPSLAICKPVFINYPGNILQLNAGEHLFSALAGLVARLDHGLLFGVTHQLFLGLATDDHQAASAIVCKLQKVSLRNKNNRHR